jgi:Family of unknown function (DUF5681)
MSEYEIGYGKPPKGTRFKNGNNANPKGRPKRKPENIADIINKISNTTTQYQERGRTKKATWTELAFRRRIRLALAGNLRGIEMVLKDFVHAQRVGGSGDQTVEVHDWLPDYPGQTGEQKTREFAAQGDAKATEWWTPSDSDPTDTTI